MATMTSEASLHSAYPPERTFTGRLMKLTLSATSSACAAAFSQHRSTSTISSHTPALASAYAQWLPTCPAPRMTIFCVPWQSSCPGNNKTPPTSASSGQGRNVCVRGATLIRAKAPLPDTIISATGNVRPAVGHFSRPPQTILFRSLSGARTVFPSLRHADLIFLRVIGLCVHYKMVRIICQPYFSFSEKNVKTGAGCARRRRARTRLCGG